MSDEKIQATAPRFEPEFYSKLIKRAKANHRGPAAEIERLTILGYEMELLQERLKSPNDKK